MKRFVLEMTACAAFATTVGFIQVRSAHTAEAAHARGPAHMTRADESNASAPITPASPLRDWLVNPGGHVDGVLLDDGRAFFFDPSLARTLLLSIRIGDPLRIDVRDGVRHLVDERDGSSVSLLLLARGGGPGAQPALTPMTARGNVAEWVRLPEGTIGGFILDTGEQVRLSPGLAARLRSLRLRDMVIVEGLGTRGEYGVGLTPLHIYDNQGLPLF